MNYLIDTNIISEVRKGSRCDANVAAWYDTIKDSQLYLSVLVLGEIRKGVERAKIRGMPQAFALERWLAAVVQGFAGRILSVDQAVADEWGRMSAKRPLSTIDTLLAATAKVHRMTLATRNTSHVADLGAEVINPFLPRSHAS